MRLKRWESPRREGRNNKGKGGSARQRQLKKRRQMLRQKLKEASKQDNQKNQQNNHHREDKIFPVFYLSFTQITAIVWKHQKHLVKLRIFT